MIKTLILLFIGALIGWNFPQPKIVQRWTGKAKDKADEVYKGITKD